MTANPDPETEDGRVIVQRILDKIEAERVKLETFKAMYQNEQVRLFCFSPLLLTSSRPTPY
jgi:hypothetical protein